MHYQRVRRATRILNPRGGQLHLCLPGISAAEPFFLGRLVTTVVLNSPFNQLNITPTAIIP